ncbi:chaperone [Trichosporon asahii var. asahii CBS 2479]|uniref:Mitochondrial import inner membrane translocase subunit n=1 Tax=Trichosporon asahii var. asahii (strain ATCC 90039 / CBS 2479 / JCM 2466 / KCTC 7840 / NBRC 103889/ NCYC 2677 / UAMH 7654) TaxID=1186058 RepID=J5Q2E5_TRIAS|nr:chaperone [Trichosporon asahii var. asahii CBS 2479]EJT45108.1 chaperone [Trichosporon asahii var. asahii CBS 2479]
MQDFMKLYSGIVERCFLACAQDFTTKALTSNETRGREQMNGLAPADSPSRS